MRRNFFPAFLLGASLFGLCIGMAMTLYPPAPEVSPWRKPLVGSIIGLICVLGVLAAIFPGACSRFVGFRAGLRPAAISSAASERRAATRGHHPDCGKFSSHVLRVGGGTICAGCTGLLIGGLVSLAGTIWYFFLNLNFGQAAILMSWIGASGVAMGLLLPPLLNIPWSTIRLLLNFFFAMGSFLILAGADAMAESTLVDVFLVVMVSFWLFTRVVLSKWGHDRICGLCGEAACGFRSP